MPDSRGSVVTLNREEALGDRTLPSSRFGHIFLDDEFHSSLLVRTD